ncbi:beta-L-arabinofuranosidase domain-containing protein [Micromonospora sp. NPDC050276]|uniref:beta-L-arabinofuranosidase domain-containing protein n=1 Tax=Micromonospora sp. NPDC050276 TaxID=3364278 RepID=UPI0037AA18F9
MTLAQPFPLRDVALHDGVQARAQEQMLHLARVYPVDRALAVLRANAGLDTRGAEPPGNWEDFGHPEEQPWSASDYPGAGVAPTASLLRGHYAGHFLSMLALAYASTGDPAIRDKSDSMVAGLAEVQGALAATGRFSHPGFLAAYGEWQFARLEELAPYGEIWAPWYTCHKILAGLLHAYEHTGSKPALEVAARMGHWAASRILRVDRAQRQRMWSLYIAGEFGGMNESLVILHRYTGEPSFLEAAAAFEMDGLLDAAVAGRDVLDGMHANQHLPMLIGHLTQYEATGDRRYLDAVLTLWDQIVPGRTFAHGGTGEGELWGPADTIAGFVGRRNAESCATYNLLRIARGLFGHTLDGRYVDYVERASLNHIVGSRADVASDTSPEVVYMYPVDPGAVREYDNVGTCCGGTGLESHVKHQESVWFAAPGELFVLQYVPSRLTWAEAGGEVELRTRYPREGRVTLAVDVDGPVALHLRIPPWARGRQQVRVNGAAHPAPVSATGFVTVRREFRRGDTVELTLPLPLRLVPTLDDPSLVSLELGPTVLLARDDATTTLSVAPAAHRLLDGSLAGADSDGDLVTVLGHTFEPAWSGGDRRHHMYLRLDDPDIAFRGSAPGVPDRHDQHGWSFLTGLWADGGYATIADFLAAAHRHALRAARAGLLSRAEVGAVLVAASSSTLDDPAVPRRGTTDPRLPAGRDWSERTDLVVPDARVWRSADPVEDLVVWSLPADVGAADAVPVIRLDVVGERAASGWYTSPPAFTVTVVSPGPGVSGVEAAVGDGNWQPVNGERPLPDGRHRLRARATDSTGRTFHATREVDVDTTPPVATARVRSLGRSVEVTLDATDEVSGVDRIQWRTAETFWGVYQEPFSRTLRQEPQVLEFTASDRAGNTTPVQRVELPPLD